MKISEIHEGNLNTKFIDSAIQMFYKKEDALFSSNSILIILSDKSYYDLTINLARNLFFETKRDLEKDFIQYEFTKVIKSGSLQNDEFLIGKFE